MIIIVILNELLTLLSVGNKLNKVNCKLAIDNFKYLYLCLCLCLLIIKII